jgi:hypothetical protein
VRHPLKSSDLRREKSANYYIVKSQRFFVKVSSIDDLGIGCFVSKPVDNEDFVKNIEAILS